MMYIVYNNIVEYIYSCLHKHILSEKVKYPDAPITWRHFAELITFKYLPWPVLNPEGGKVKKSWLELLKINETKHKIHKYEL